MISVSYIGNLGVPRGILGHNSDQKSPKLIKISQKLTNNVEK